MGNGVALSTIIQKIFDGNLGIILACDDKGRIIYLNETGKKELEYREGEVKIQDVFRSFVPEDTDIQTFMKGIDGKTAETNVYRKNNTCFSALIRACRIESGIEYNIFSIQNTQYETYAKREVAKVENNMKEVMRARNEFVANVTHELRTPLNGIKGHAKDLHSIEEQPERKKTLGIILKCCENMEKIINNFLDFSKIEAGKFEITESPFNFRESIQHVIDTSISIANEKGLKILVYIAPEIPDVVIGDELRVVQILNNLVSNALKFTSIGYINIEVYKTRLTHGRMELTFFVIDTGAGISLEEKEKLFKSFSQVDGSVTRKYGGTGLGLYVTKQLVELMHGSISVESEKGKGSTFTFTIEVGVEGEVAEMEQTEPIITHMKMDENGEPYIESLNQIYIYGSTENRTELQSNFEKLLLCIEMGNWEKAEFFSDNIKQLVNGAEQNIKSKVFKMQMAVRKEDYDKSVEQLNNLKQLIGL